MNTQHTAGQWHAKDGQIYPLETGKTLALIPHFDEDDKEQQANANLIAAAPDLLRALNNMVNISYDTARPTKSEKNHAIDLALAAISKAVAPPTQKETSNTKSFLWTDKTGRGETATVLFTNIGFDEEEVNYDGITLYEWADNAAQGEEWENATDKYICTKS